MKTETQLILWLFVLTNWNCLVFGSLRGNGSKCITNQADLRTAVENAASNEVATTPTTINLCVDRILLEDDSGEGIDMSNKSIVLNCTLKDSEKKCALDGQFKTRILYGQSARLTVERVRFMNGNSNTGGALYFSGNSSITINKGCTFSDNTASGGGGAIAVTSNSSLIIQGSGTLINSTSAVFFQDNKASSGAAIYAEGSTVKILKMASFFGNEGYATIQLYLDAQILLSNSRIFKNTGMGVFLEMDSQGIFDKVTFDSNTADNCAGLYVKTGAFAIIKNSVFSSNFANEDGGGLCVNQVDEVNITNVKFVNNTALRYGGAMWSNYGDSIKIQNSFFTNNIAGDTGGGLYMYGATKAKISRTPFTNNTGLEFASALYAELSTLQLYRVDFIRNLNTGAIRTYNNDQVTFDSSRFIENQMRAITNVNDKIILFNTTFIPDKQTLGTVGHNIYSRYSYPFVSCKSRNVFCGGYGIYNDVNDLAATTDCIDKGIIGTIGVGTCRI